MISADKRRVDQYRGHNDYWLLITEKARRAGKLFSNIDLLKVVFESFFFCRSLIIVCDLTRLSYCDIYSYQKYILSPLRECKALFITCCQITVNSLSAN